MVESKEYALKKLDEWYVNRFRERYTDEVERKLCQDLETGPVNKIGNFEVPSEFIDALQSLPGNLNLSIWKSYKFSDILPFILKKESWMPFIEKYFSQSYSTMEAAADGQDTDEFNIKNLHESVKNEYIEPIFKEFRKFKVFVDGVRKKTEEIFPNDLTDKDINNEFIKNFGGHKGFTEFAISYMNALPYLLDIQLRRGEISKEENDITLNILKAYKEVLPYINERLFGDLA